LALAGATLFSTERQGQTRQCKVAIDCLRNGESVQLEMQKRGWWNFHQWMRYDKKRLRLKDSQRIGWFSNAWSRAMMMDYIIRAIKDEWIEVNSPYFVDEMGDLERDDMRQSLKATYGGHDDLFVSMGQIYFSMMIMDVRSGKPIVVPHRLAHKEQVYEDPVWSPGFQGSDTGPREYGTRDELLAGLEYEEE